MRRTTTGASSGFRGRTAALVAALLAATCLLAIGTGAACTAASPSSDGPAEDDTPALYVEDKQRDQPQPAWYEIDGDALVLRIDKARIESAVVGNYPAFGPEGTRFPKNLDEVTALLPLVEGRVFKAAQSLESWNEEQRGYAGGYSTYVEFLDGNGDVVGLVSYNPALPGDGVAVIADGTIYAMEGDQSEVVALLDDLVSRYAGLDASGAAEEGQAARA